MEEGVLLCAAVTEEMRRSERNVDFIDSSP